MFWLVFMRKLVEFALSLTGYLDRKQLIDAGEAQAISEGLQSAQRAITKARRARLAAIDDFDKRNGVPDDDDPNLRD